MNITSYSEYNYYLSQYWELIHGKWYKRGEDNRPFTPNDVIMEYLRYTLEKSKGELYG